MSENAYVNTDREIWREVDGDYYSPSIFVTEGGKIGINVGGYVTVMDVRDWHSLAKTNEIADLYIVAKTDSNGNVIGYPKGGGSSAPAYIRAFESEASANRSRGKLGGTVMKVTSMKEAAE